MSVSAQTASETVNPHTPHSSSPTEQTSNPSNPSVAKPFSSKNSAGPSPILSYSGQSSPLFHSSPRRPPSGSDRPRGPPRRWTRRWGAILPPGEINWGTQEEFRGVLERMEGREKEYAERCGWYTEVSTAPRSLQHCCRVQIRQAMEQRG